MAEDSGHLSSGNCTSSWVCGEGASAVRGLLYFWCYGFLTNFIMLLPSSCRGGFSRGLLQGARLFWQRAPL